MHREHLTAQRTTAVPPLLILVLACALGSWAPLAAGQRNLGDLLDAGGTRLTPQEFRQEVVHRTIVGPTAAGGSIEIMYVPNGRLQGMGTYQGTYASPATSVNGDWTTDDSGRVCTAMQIHIGGGRGVTLPARCQYWYRHGSQYFFSDSDTDRSARVFPRTPKP
jgi:hypothetical protein